MTFFRTYCKDCLEPAFGLRCRSCQKKKSRIDWKNPEEVRRYNRQKYWKKKEKKMKELKLEPKPIPKQIKNDWRKVLLLPKVVYAPRLNYLCKNCCSVELHSKQGKHYICSICGNPNRRKSVLIKSKTEFVVRVEGRS